MAQNITQSGKTLTIPEEVEISVQGDCETEGLKESIEIFNQLKKREIEIKSKIFQKFFCVKAIAVITVIKIGRDNRPLWKKYFNKQTDREKPGFKNFKNNDSQNKHLKEKLEFTDNYLIINRLALYRPNNQSYWKIHQKVHVLEIKKIKLGKNHLTVII